MFAEWGRRTECLLSEHTCSSFDCTENIFIFFWQCVSVCLLPSGASASDLVLQCTPEGIRLQCYMNYYTEEMKTVWKHKYDLHIYISHRQDSNIYSFSWDVTTFCSSQALFLWQLRYLYFNYLKHAYSIWIFLISSQRSIKYMWDSIFLYYYFF